MQRPIADQIADIGRDPTGTGLDELVVVKLVDVLFEHGKLVGKGGQKGAQRRALFGIAQAVHRWHQVIQALRGQTGHGITSTKSKGAGSSVKSSDGSATPASTRMRDASSLGCREAVVCSMGRVPP